MGAYIWRGDLTEGFLRYEFGGSIFGGAYTWRGLFSGFYGVFAQDLPIPAVFWPHTSVHRLVTFGASVLWEVSASCSSPCFFPVLLDSLHLALPHQSDARSRVAGTYSAVWGEGAVFRNVTRRCNTAKADVVPCYLSPGAQNIRSTSQFATDSQGARSFMKKPPLVRTVLDGLYLIRALRSCNVSFGSQYAMKTLRFISTV